MFACRALDVNLKPGIGFECVWPRDTGPPEQAAGSPLAAPHLVSRQAAHSEHLIHIEAGWLPTSGLPRITKARVLVLANVLVGSPELCNVRATLAHGPLQLSLHVLRCVGRHACRVEPQRQVGTA